MSGKDPQEQVMEIVALVGKPEAERLLVAEKVSLPIAARLCRGAYDHKIGVFMADAIARARAKAAEMSDAS